MVCALDCLSAWCNSGFVCLALLTLCRQAVTDDSGTELEPDTASIKLKLGALFDVRARHLTDAFQSAVDQHNRDEQERKGSRHRHHDVESLDNRRGDIISIIFDPVITFVDVTDSFAVSNAMCDLIAHDVIAIVGITNASSLPTIQSYSATFHVPFLSLGSSQNVTSSAPFQLSLRPPVMAAVVDLLQHQGCASALYIYDSDEGLMRIQDLFQAINIRELYLELDVRRIGDKAHVTEISKIIGSLHPRRELCLTLDLERLSTVAVIDVFANDAPTVKDVILVTLDAEFVLDTVLTSAERRPARFNVSGLQLVPSLTLSRSLYLYPDHARHHHTFQTWSSARLDQGDARWKIKDPKQLSKHFEKDDSLSSQGRKYGRSAESVDDYSESEDKSAKGINQGGRSSPASEYLTSQVPYEADDLEIKHSDTQHSPEQFDKRNSHTTQAKSQSAQTLENELKILHSSEALIIDCLKVLTTALYDLWDALGDVFQSSDDVSQEDLSIKCTNFVVEKKQYGADLMEALKLVHVHGETRYICFDTNGKREDYTLSFLSIQAGSRIIRNEADWSSVSGWTSHPWSRDGVKSYTIFGNMSKQSGRKVLLGVVD
ncbi:uncharacterized protein [Littorina saxatilis]|uniref:uncharacterized protein n=1 Tax=Littorina saxatilis TaxID=31220 RepID=UPI0038B42736